MRVGAMQRGLGTALVIAVALTGCATQGKSPRAQFCSSVGSLAGAAAAGAALGGAVGPAVGDSGGNNAPAKRMAVGAAIGAASGAALHIVLCNREGTPPNVSASASPRSGEAPLVVEFRATGSDPQGQALSWSWDFGDGTRADSQNARHTYAKPGHYTARASATNADGLSAQGRATVHVSDAAPAVTRRIVLRGVHFDFDRAAIKPAAEAVLFQASEILKKNPELRIQVAGYTDSTGSAAYNQGLSERRASSVKGWLAAHGISAGRLDAVGFGESMPVADNDTEVGRAQNRRVELNVLQ